MEKYFRNYAEPEAAALGALPDREPWSRVLVIPACNESPRFLRPPPPCAGRSLLILVVNQNESASATVTASNRLLADTVRARFEPLAKRSARDTGRDAAYGMELLTDRSNPRDVLLVDRFSEGRRLPVKGGVGHARKAGCDLAASLINSRRVRTRWIHCSDADVRLPDTYFSAAGEGDENGASYSALVYPYRHGDAVGRDREEVERATLMYELSLHWYVAGLKSAGSPYAFQTVGSTMAVDAVSYTRVRGFPRRDAGEDFYLLNKLAKVGPVRELEPGPGCLPIEIESRRSDRVPFGTGAAVNAITRLPDPGRDFRFYHPGVFELLEAWLRSWPAIRASGSTDFGPHVALPPSRLRSALLEGLATLKTAHALDHAFRHGSDPAGFTRQMHTWFDAFRTLKLVHFLRDHGLPSVDFQRLEREPLFRRLLEQNPGLAAARARQRL
jgi:hypothetical protein